MEIIIGKTAGFCGGVRRAVEEAKKITDKEENEITYCLGDLVHNRNVITRLEKNGLRIVNSLSEIPNPKGNKVIFRAHGVTKQTYEEAERLGLEIIDLTCINVINIHKIAYEYVKKNAFIFYIGEKGHPEVVGTESFCGDNYALIETEEDLRRAISYLLEKTNSNDFKELLVISQTTFRLEKFEEFVQEIQEKLGDKLQITIKNTICNATRLRQDETEELAKNVEFMIVIGGKKSSNTNKLYDISAQKCSNAIMIESKEELTEDIINRIKKCNKVGIMAGASTPQDIIDDIRNTF